MSYTNRVKQLIINKKERRKCCRSAFDSGQAEQCADYICENCAKVFLRGLFLSCGSISDPQDAYHLEFALSCGDFAERVQTDLKSAGINIKYVKRRSKHVLYIKSSEQIEDFLYYIDAEKFMFELIDAKIIKSVRNDANRSRNFESANLDKMSRASAEQIEAIEELKSGGKFESLPEELKQTAELRLNNIELSLSELGEMSTPMVTKSAILHRMRKIINLAGRY